MLDEIVLIGLYGCVSEGTRPVDKSHRHIRNDGVDP